MLCSGRVAVPCSGVSGRVTPDIRELKKLCLAVAEEENVPYFWLLALLVVLLWQSGAGTSPGLQ